MKAFLYIDQEKIGEVDLQETDRAMGALGGILTQYDVYGKYQMLIQEQY